MRKFLIPTLCVSVFINVVLILFLFNSEGVKPSAQSANPFYPYLSPRIFASNQNDILINFVPLRKELRDYVDKSPHKLGVYFEYLPSGVSIGINEKEEFVSASLLKVPLIMGVYKLIDDKKIQPDTQIKIIEPDLDKRFGELWKAGPGQNITVSELVRYTIEKSDNTAANALFRTLNGARLDDVFDSLDIPKDADSNRAVITTKNYSSILRSLFLSSYLPKNLSNQLLELLTKTEYKDKLPAGVPNEIKVAHKIGVYGNTPNENNVIYTDCGIVYVPRRPYILCMMTISNDTQARQSMKNVSSLVYQYVSSVDKDQ